MKITNILGRLGCGFLILFSATASNAKTINMYDQPVTNAKSVGSLDSEHSIITIFTPNGSEWTKVADPRNGNVGWVKTSDIGNSSFNFKIITGDTGNHKYQIYQYGNMPAQSPAKIENEIKLMQLRQQIIQRDMQHMMNDMFSMTYYPTPVFVPVFLAPDQHSINNTTSTSRQNAKATQTSAEDAKNNIKH